MRASIQAGVVGITVLATLGDGGPKSWAQETDALPRPPGVRLVPLDREPGIQETSVAVHPRDSRNVIVSYQQHYPVHKPFAAVGVARLDAHVAWSTDGGESWTIAQGTAPPNHLQASDTSVTFDLHGHAFLSYIALDSTAGPGTYPYWAKGASRNGVFIRRSLDGGRTWEPFHTALLEFPIESESVFQDKPYLVADNSPSGPHAGNLYVGWTKYSLEKSEVMFSRSTDDGKTWSSPRVISTDPGVPRGDSCGALLGFHAAVGRDGAVYATWSDGQAIVLAIARDGGQTLERSRRIVPTTCSFVGLPDFPGAYGFPAMGIAPHVGSKGRLFVTWGDYRNGDTDIFASTSDDGGRTWAAAIRVNDDPKHNGKDQILSWLAVDPSDSSAYVVFYDRRGDTQNALATVTLARSTDGGHTFTNYGWEPRPSDPRLAGHGDYIGLAASEGRVYGAWPEGAPAAEKTPAGDAPSVIQIGIADFRPDAQKTR